MVRVAGRSEKIQELANLKAEGAITIAEFCSQMATVLNNCADASDDLMAPHPIDPPRDQEVRRRDNSIAVAGVLGIAGIAVMLLFIALGAR